MRHYTSNNSIVTSVGNERYIPLKLMDTHLTVWNHTVWNHWVKDDMKEILQIGLKDNGVTVNQRYGFPGADSTIQ